MRLLVFRALWGMTGPPPEQLERIATAGYDGVEGWFDPSNPLPRTEFAALAQQHSLKVIMGTGIRAKEDLARQLAQVAEYQPMKISVQSGRDSMTHDEGCAFFEEALRVEQRIGIPVAHETHRGRILFTPWEAAFYLRQFEQLHINADYSHWVNVCERMLDDQEEAVQLANQRAIHIHGRVGYEEGPQVPDPSAPEYGYHLAWHEAQWQRISEQHEERGAEYLTFTPEYGPPNYLHALPHTKAPVADLWEVCLWGMGRARETLG